MVEWVTLVPNKAEGWQNGYCAALEKPWAKALTGSSPVPSALNGMLDFINKIGKKQYVRKGTASSNLVPTALRASAELSRSASSIQAEIKSTKPGWFSAGANVLKHYKRLTNLSTRDRLIFDILKKRGGHNGQK